MELRNGQPRSVSEKGARSPLTARRLRRHQSRADWARATVLWLPPHPAAHKPCPTPSAGRHTLHARPTPAFELTRGVAADTSVVPSSDGRLAWLRSRFQICPAQWARIGGWGSSRSYGWSSIVEWGWERTPRGLLSGQLISYAASFRWEHRALCRVL